MALEEPQILAMIRGEEVLSISFYSMPAEAPFHWYSNTREERPLLARNDQCL